ncbi:membrane-associated protein, putative [Bodo saltans]|uniref:Membrane-associated protein, putative n=1 Tax=Bodo saltans TaxID=75058 RepID=A0A0S4IS92_BODSA|nr:membrane-associated protein, putative [Bodo saltans]|eukprot:CUE82750.1 membrane-associated protein, putative [Bodo saltans]
MNTRVDAFLTLLFLFLLSFPSPTASRTNTSTPSSNVSETISVLVTPSVDVTPSQQDPSLSESATMTMTAQMTNHSMTLSPRWVSESGPTSSSTLTLSGTEDLSETRSFRLSETISARTFSSERTETRTVSDSVTNDRSSSLTWDNNTFTSTNTMSVSNSSSRGSLTLSPSLTNTPSLTNSSSPSETQSPSLQGTPTYIRTYTQYTPTPNTSTFTSSPSISRSPTNTTSGPTPPMSASNTTTASLSLSTSASNSTSTSGSESWSMTSSSSKSFSPTVFASPSKGSTSPTTTGEMTISHLAPYTVPRAVYNTSTVVDQVFLARIQSFYIDPADISIPAFTRDLFRAMVAATTNASAAAGTPASSLYYLTESAAYVGNVLLVSVCQVDYVELDAGWNRFYNMSACRRDDVGPACTTTGSTSCKVKTVNYCNCSSLWQTYPPNSFVNLSTIPNYPEPPPTPAPTLVNNSGNHSSVNRTAAAEAASRRQFRSLDADSTNLVVQIQFSFLLQNAPAFRPKTQKDIIGNYTLLRKTLDTVLFGSYTDLHLAYFLLPGSGNVSNNSFFPTPPVIPVVRITSSSSFLPVMALLVFVAIGGGIVIHKLYKYIRWRMTVGRFRVAPRDSSSNNVDGGESGKEVDPNDMDDVEMVAKLGDGAWVKSGMTATTSATTFALPSVAASANAFGESSATFDPLAANANRELQKQQQGADGKKGGEKSGGDMSSEDSRSSSGKQLDESDENNSNGVVRALHKHHFFFFFRQATIEPKHRCVCTDTHCGSRRGQQRS